MTGNTENLPPSLDFCSLLLLLVVVFALLLFFKMPFDGCFVFADGFGDDLLPLRFFFVSSLL